MTETMTDTMTETLPDTMTDTLRDWTACACLCVAFLIGCFFYGVGYNLLFLFANVALLLLAFGLQGPNVLLDRAAAAPAPALVVLFFLVGLLIVQLVFSISPDTSMAPSWVLASAPLWYLVSLGMRHQERLFGVLLVLVSLFAAIAFVRFLVAAQRAYDPLVDAGSFGALLYLVWIPLAHWCLARIWYRNEGGWLLPALLAVSFLFLVAIFATASRAAQALALAPLLGWLLVAYLRGVSVRPVLLLGVVAACAYALFYLRSPDMFVAMSDVGSGPQDVEPGISQRWIILQSTWEALQAQGLWGSGVYTFSLLYPLYRSYADQTSAGIYVHNDYAQFALEGGVWLFVPLCLAGVMLAVAAFRSLHPKLPLAQFERAGGYWALGALFVHACVNFVFYSLALCMVAGAVAAWAQSHRQPQPRPPDDLRGVFGWWFGWLFGLLLAAYLALDVTIYSVFSGQPGLPGTAHYRASSDAQFRFARLAENLNGDRGLPVLAQALALDARLQANPQSDFLQQQTLNTYLRAQAKDVWNPEVHVAFAGFLARTGIRPDGQTPESVLQQALALDSRRVSTLQALARYYDAAGEPALAYAVLKREGLPWLENFAIKNPRRALEFVDDLGRRAHRAQDEATVERLWQFREQLLARPPAAANPVWFMRMRERMNASEAPSRVQTGAPTGAPAGAPLQGG